METEDVPPSVVIPIELAPKGPRTGCFICKSRDHYHKDCSTCEKRRPPGVAQQKSNGAIGLGTSGSLRVHTSSQGKP